MHSTTITKLINKLGRPHLFLLENCKNMKELKKFHAHFITNGLFNNTLFLSSLLSFTALSPSGDLGYAHLVFNDIDSPNVFMFNTMIRGYSYSSDPKQSINMYIRMLRFGLFPNNFTFPFVIKASSQVMYPTYAYCIHGSVIKFGHVLDLHVSNSLLHVYASLGLSKEIFKVFDEMPEPDVVSWNVIINDIGQCGSLDEVLIGFSEMRTCGIEPNSVSILGIVSACSKAGNLYIGRLIHLYIIKNFLNISENLGNGLLDMYAKLGDINSAKKLFERMIVKTAISWTTMIDGFIQKGDLESAILLFDQMPEKDITSWNVMLNGFILAGQMKSAKEIFEAIPQRDLVSWNSMIGGYAQNKNYVKSLMFFKEMLISGVNPDQITVVSVFSVCGLAGLLDLGDMTHCHMEKQNIKGEVVDVALMDMYSKCGAPEKALRTFNEILNKSVLAWSAIIVGLATNGLAIEALEFFQQMCIEGKKPNEVTFIGVLCACSYGGLVEEGKWFFNAMSEVFGIEPRSEHFGCMVDILGRGGYLKEAEDFIENLQIEADAGVWGALLGACTMHGEVEMGKKVAITLAGMDSNRSGQHVLLSNMYAEDNRWVDVEKVRKKMRMCGVKKMPGFSLIQLKGEMRQFMAGDGP